MVARNNRTLVNNLLISGTVYGCLSFIHAAFTTFFVEPYTVNGVLGVKTKTRLEFHTTVVGVESSTWFFKSDPDPPPLCMVAW